MRITQSKIESHQCLQLCFIIGYIVEKPSDCLSEQFFCPIEVSVDDPVDINSVTSAYGRLFKFLALLYPRVCRTGVMGVLGFLVKHPVLWNIVMWMTMIGGTLVAITGICLGFRYIVRRLKKLKKYICTD
jgi:hypothetical protein